MALFINLQETITSFSNCVKQLQLLHNSSKFLNQAHPIGQTRSNQKINIFYSFMKD